MSEAQVEFEFARLFDAGWSAAGESAEILAGKVQALLCRLAAIEPAYGDVRPAMASGDPLSSDPVGIRRMSVRELGSLIEEHMGAPAFAGAPPDMDGFHLFLESDLPLLEPRKLKLSIHGGEQMPREQHGVELALSLESPVWRKGALALPILDTLIDVEGCEWASASTVFTDFESYFRRPWMSWRADVSKPLPRLLQFDEAPPPTQREAYRGGELCTWSWESVKQSVGRRMICFGYD